MADGMPARDEQKQLKETVSRGEEKVNTNCRIKAITSLINFTQKIRHRKSLDL